MTALQQKMAASLRRRALPADWLPAAPRPLDISAREIPNGFSHRMGSASNASSSSGLALQRRAEKGELPAEHSLAFSMAFRGLQQTSREQHSLAREQLTHPKSVELH